MAQFLKKLTIFWGGGGGIESRMQVLPFNEKNKSKNKKNNKRNNNKNNNILPYEHNT